MLIVEKEKKGVTRRNKGERTRHQILIATIKILAKNGIKGTTHRAIAKEADIQLSLTTYYFKDIEELIHQAILLNSEITLYNTAPVWFEVFQLFTHYEKSDLRKIATKQTLADQLTALLTTATIERIEKHSDELSVEQIMFSHTHITPALKVIAKKHKEVLLEPYIKLCGYFNKKTARLDAEILFTQIKQLEYRLLTEPLNNNSESSVHPLISRVISLVLKLKS
ncbi:MAG: TetR/AcrR family transcriptional regulator [Thalassotalea sp.]